LAIPFDALALPDATSQRAGEVSRVITGGQPRARREVHERQRENSGRLAGCAEHQANGRARVSLDDGSVLNVGSDSSVKVVKHDAGAQQTDLEVNGRENPLSGAKNFAAQREVRGTHPSGVAGVVGTDFYVGYENNIMTVIFFDGVVKVCNLAGVCVTVKAGQVTTVRNSDSNGPAATVAGQPLHSLGSGRQHHSRNRPGHWPDSPHQ